MFSALTRFALALFFLVLLTAQTGVVPSRSTVTLGGTATKPCGTLRSEGALAITTIGIIEEILRTYTLPANSLANSGDRVRVEAWYTTAANVNSKTARLYFGATQATPSITTTTSGQALYAYAEIIRTGASAQDIIGWGIATAAVAPARTLGAISLAADVAITARGLTPTAAGDITLQSFMVECGKAP
jgi:hypothetical protein